jgi:thioredoxin 1
MIIEVDETDYQETVLEEFSKGRIVILKFGSPYCDACMAMDFELEELDETLENITIVEIDCASAESLAEMHDIMEVPTIKIYKDRDTLIFESVGVTLCADILKIIEES